ncbi:xanthine dehydrogenase, molybdenum binding subunit apoprotein [Sporobacter termitidis DSM 10068]|uniref:Xanthine dehydrogenase, molybdenum binding subunit apoprotein n=1 Tax=Sporobacter termitidis DSM 10068 TaxID=1123282 RepID=A0A1M5YC03_9FIRM|nr:xanthine dehydrogenase family protein molybdopterin-binding subunit [Sporobacter termitidis]SHI09600.1 xanthine dehydrogenase, molybdenum binding subunit apoprotein [Sporobacter termitidis DSM 10068]
MPETGIGVAVPRKEAADKVTGGARYTDDHISPGVLTARTVTSTCAHGTIVSLDVSAARELPGVRAVLTGGDTDVLTGSVIEDRPPLARDKVRYYGEPVALVVADSDAVAARAVTLVQAAYAPLPVVNSPLEAVAPGAALVHEALGSYKKPVEDVYPEPGTNICDREKIRKGDIQKGFAESNVILRAAFDLPQTDHVAMETRAAQARIAADGSVYIHAATQGPFEVKKALSKLFALDEGKVIVQVPLVGGAFGGKAGTELEILAYLASKAVGGRPVRIRNDREADMTSSPCGIGLHAEMRLGAMYDGTIKAAEMTFLVETGAYTDTGPRMTKAIAADCTGPYNIENLSVDSLCVYTNHPYVTSLRGFGHTAMTFCMERMLDKLAAKLRFDPAKLREKNALKPGQTSPGQVKLTESSLGNLPACIEKVKYLIGWSNGIRTVSGGKIIAKGLCCFWKTSTSPPDAVSGALVSFNEDGTVNLNVGCVEIGPAMKTTAAQILSAALKMDVGRIHVNMDVDTRYSPRHWKTVASMTAFMVGRAVLSAAEDVKRQLVGLGAAVMKCAPEDLEVGDGRVYRKSDPAVHHVFKDLVHGYQFENGNAVGGQLFGRGSYVMGDLNYLDRETGKGKSGPYWTVGAQAVEVAYDEREYTYRLLRAATVIDAGKILNPAMAAAVVRGGMCMGLGKASREHFQYGPDGRVLDTSLRTYKVMHFAETPRYLVDFVETPNLDGPYGARGLGEHGVIGMPAALANALSLASGAELDELPLLPEKIWLKKTGGII